MAICNHLTITHDFLLESNSKKEPDSQPVPQSCSLDIISRSATCLKAALGITQPHRGSLGTPQSGCRKGDVERSTTLLKNLKYQSINKSSNLFYYANCTQR